MKPNPSGEPGMNASQNMTSDKGLVYYTDNGGYIGMRSDAHR